MKITRKQLRRIIKEQVATVNKEEIKDIVMDVLSDEGGAAGLDPIEDALEDIETDDISLPDESIEDIIDDVSGVKRHVDGDYVDTTKLENRLRRIVKEQLSLEDVVDEIIDDVDHDHHGGRKLGYGEGEGRMTKSQLDKLARYSQSLHDQLMDDDDLPEWVQSKVAVAAENIGKVYHYLDYKMKRMEQESDT